MKPIIYKLLLSLLTLWIPGGGHIFINRIKSFFIYYALFIFFNTIVFVVFLDYLNPLFLWMIHIGNAAVYISALFGIVKTDYSNIKVTESIVIKITLFIVAIIITILIQYNSTISFGIMKTGDMVPTIRKDDSLIIKENQKIIRNQVIVYNDQKSNIQFIRRVVAMENDEFFVEKGTLYIHYREGDQFMQTLYAKDKLAYIDNKYWIKYQNIQRIEASLNEERVTVEEGRYFVLNDNAQKRTFRSVLVDNIVGEAILVYFSFADFQRVGLRVK